MKPLRLATRGSDLAVAQSGWVAERVEAALGAPVELLRIRTSGDRLAEVSLAAHGGKGLFVKEIEEALLAGRADLAVHSAKDLPAEIPEGLRLAAFPERADPRDALVAGGRWSGLDALPPGAVVGTGSARRTMWLRARYPHLTVKPLRGNVPTRIDKMRRGECDAVILACAGVDRLGLAASIDARIDPAAMLPAVGQGVLALQTRREGALGDDLGALGDETASLAFRAERGFLRELGGDCNVPLAAYAEVETGSALRLRAALGLPDGTRIEEATLRGEDPEALGIGAARAIRERGGDAILAELRGDG